MGSTGALIRGGNFNNGTNAGVFAVNGNNNPSNSNNNIGFRCARELPRPGAPVGSLCRLHGGGANAVGMAGSRSSCGAAHQPRRAK